MEGKLDYSKAYIYEEATEINKQVEGDPQGMELAKLFTLNIPTNNIADSSSWYKVLAKLQHAPHTATDIPSMIQKHAKFLEQGDVVAKEISEFVNGTLFPGTDLDKLEGGFDKGELAAKLVVRGLIHDAFVVKGLSSELLNEDVKKSLEKFVESAQEAYPPLKEYRVNGNLYSASSNNPGVRVLAYVLIKGLPGIMAEPTIAERAAYKLKQAPAAVSALRRFVSQR